MAKIVLGLGTSHGPMLSTPWEKWDGRVAFDRQNPRQPFKGGVYNFEELVELRRDENLAAEITPEKWQARSKACADAIEELADRFAAAAPDVAVIVGNDQEELFSTDNFPALCVYYGETIENRPRTPEQIANLPPGVAIAERGHAPPEDAVYRGCPELGRHIIESLMDAEFDVAASSVLPKGTGYVNGVPHAFGFIYRQIMRDAPVPSVPILINTFYPPNQPSAARCYDFGLALRDAIESWPDYRTVAVFASGGLSHFVIDEDLDRKVLDAFLANDREALISIPNELYQSGSSEIKNWIPVSAAMTAAGKDMKLIDYVPCYRSEAGTGNAMGFVVWE